MSNPPLATTGPVRYVRAMRRRHYSLRDLLRDPPALPAGAAAWSSAKAERDGVLRQQHARERMAYHDMAPSEVRAVDHVFGDTGVAWQLWVRGVRTEESAEAALVKMLEARRA